METPHGGSSEARLPVDTSPLDSLPAADPPPPPDPAEAVPPANEKAASLDGEEPGICHENRVSDLSLVSYDARPRPPLPPGTHWMCGLRVGDMVWGKVKSHPWWPGQIFEERFARAGVNATRREGHVLVAFYGDSSYGWFEPYELMPFEPNFAEKSVQPSTRSFAKAVEEAVDETCRRGALAVTCRCRNPSNFRPTIIAGYVQVDVTGYEPRGIYSQEQIESTRNLFKPEAVVSFVQELALGPCDSEHQNTEFMKKIAMMVSYRIAVYEEFDDTYAQAFGVDPVRPPLNAADQLEGFAQRAKPLGGALKEPDREHAESSAWSEKRGSPSSAASAAAPLSKAKARGRPKGKEKAKAKALRFAAVAAATAVKTHPADDNKYLLKRRDDAVGGPHALSRPHLPDLPLPPPRGTAAASASTAGAFPSALQQRSPPMAAPLTMPPPPPPEQIVFEGKMETFAAGAAGPVVPGPERKTALNHKRVAAAVDGLTIKGKIKKRKPESDSASGIIVMKKKKAIDSTKERRKRPLLERLPKMDLAAVFQDIPQVLTDLREMGINPAHGIRSTVQATACHLSLAFRAQVYQKSLHLAPPIEPDTADPAAEFHLIKTGASVDVAHGKAVREEASSMNKLPKLAMKLNEPSKSAQKRVVSDRQEEIVAKKQKRLSDIKALAMEKKAAGGGQKVLVEAQRKQNNIAMPARNAASGSGSVSAPPLARPNNRVASVDKQEPPHEPLRMPAPTALWMKFPPNSTLPSCAMLHALFARFGQLDTDVTRVHWKSYTCKVVFNFKPDAESALNHVTNNDIFNQGKVHFYIKDNKASASEAPSDSGLQRLEPRSSDPPSFRLGNGSSGGAVAQPRPLSYQQPRHPMGQPKSILKKSGDEVGAAVGGAARDAPRVKFMLDGGSSSKLEPPSMVNGSGSSNGGDGTGVLDPAMINKSRPVSFAPPPVPNSKSVGILPIQPPLTRPPTSQHYRGADALQIPTPPPSISLVPPPRTAIGLLPTPPSAAISVGLPPMPRAREPVHYRGADAPEVPIPPPPISLAPPPRTTIGLLPTPPSAISVGLPPTPHAWETAPGQAMAQFHPHRDGQNAGKAKADVTIPMLKLLVQCSEIVNGIKNSLGYLPYHPL